MSLHDDTLGTASGFVARLGHVHLASVRSTTTKGAAARGIGRHFLVVAANLANQVVEGVVNVDARLGRCLDELAAELTSQGFTLCEKN